MVNNISTQTENLFEELTGILSTESKVDQYNSQFLKYVQEKRAFVKQNADIMQVKEAIRGINRYADEFSFTDVNAKKIKALLESLYDSVNIS